jgi:hypothetical protein
MPKRNWGIWDIEEFATTSGRMANGSCKLNILLSTGETAFGFGGKKIGGTTMQYSLTILAWVDLCV